jgi:SAM-dependent methyltransferase
VGIAVGKDRGVSDVGIAFWDRRHAELRPHAAVGCDGIGDPFNRWMYRVRARVFRQAVAPLVSDMRDARVLDVGSGFGFYVDRWRELGLADVTASDAAETAIARLRSRLPDVPVLELDITETEIDAGGPYDAVSAFDVLFHLVDDAAYERAVRNLAALLRPGGLLAFSENFHLHGRRVVSAVQADRSEAEIVDLVRSAGLEPVVRRPMFWLMNEPQNALETPLATWWRLLRTALRGRPGLGHVAGPALYPIELALVLSKSPPGPSTNLMVCRRRAAAKASRSAVGR